MAESMVKTLVTAEGVPKVSRADVAEMLHTMGHATVNVDRESGQELLALAGDLEYVPIDELVDRLKEAVPDMTDGTKERVHQVTEFLLGIRWRMIAEGN